MDVNAAVSQAVQMQQASLMQQKDVAVMNRAMEAEEAAVAQLIDGMPDVSGSAGVEAAAGAAAALPDNVGTLVNTTA
ncbi:MULTISPECIES: putative motility protein [unclassified Thioalkalivibrio]|uniref:putative motility protein n=1 Tax=unclassified Thioalkalivibrio TaxID=2621013 RepID=UPI00037CDFBC|nr:MULTISPECIES: putative motility protein [unclassified Thioalkalivibrio]